MRANDSNGRFCDRNQNDPNTWFLAGTLGGKAERACKIANGKAILFPAINDLISFDENLNTEPDLRSYAKADLDEATILEVIVDSFQLTDVKNYRIQSNLFSVMIPSDIQGALVSGETKSISDGYWVFLKPLPVGLHTISFKGEKLAFDVARHINAIIEKPKFNVEVIYRISVE